MVTFWRARLLMSFFINRYVRLKGMKGLRSAPGYFERELAPGSGKPGVLDRQKARCWA